MICKSLYEKIQTFISRISELEADNLSEKGKSYLD